MSHTSIHSGQMAPVLKRELLLLLAFGWVCILAAYVPLSVFRDFHAAQWLLQSGLLWCLVWQQLWQRADLNRPGDGSAPYPALGWANRLTLLRGGLIALVGGFLFQAEATGVLAWLPALLYSLAAILDCIDGYIARRSRQTSLLGSELDMAFDALGLLVAPLLAVGYGRIHWSFLLVSAAYYLFRRGLGWRRQRELPVYELAPNALRRALAGFQMGFVAVVLLPTFEVAGDAAAGAVALTQLAGVAFMMPVLAGFAVDWLVASGRLSMQKPAVMQFFARLAGFGSAVFQPALRLVASVATLILLSADTGVLEGSDVVRTALLLCAALLLAGFAARVAALTLLMLLSSLYPLVPDPALHVLIFCTVWILLLGSGRFSLWQPGDQWVNRYAGA